MKIVFNLFQKTLFFLALMFLFSAAYGNGNRISYQMKLELNPENHQLQGKEKVIYTNLSSDSIREIYFHLNPNGFRDRKSHTFQQYENMLSEPAALDIIKVESEGRELSYSGDRTVSMKVNLDSPLLPGDSISLELEFITRIPEGGHFFCPTHRKNTYSLFLFYPRVEFYYKSGWKPERYNTIADPFGEIASYSVNLILPENFTVSGSLPIKSVEKFQGKKKIFFDSKRLLEIGIACSDNYEIIAFEYDSIRIELVRSSSGKDSSEDKSRKMPIFRDVVTDIIGFYSDVFVPYAYDHLSIVKGFVPGGYATSNYIVLDAGIFDRISDLNRSAVQVLAHEIAHEYFGFLVNAHESYETWLNEGFANYAADLYIKKRFQNLLKRHKKSVFQKVKSIPDDLMKIIFLSFEKEKALNPVYTPQRETDFTSIVDQSKYYKGQKVLEMLAYRLGEERFQKLMRAYIKRFSFRIVTTDEFFSIAERVTGEDLGNFRSRWVDNIGVADVSVSEVKSEQTGNGKFSSTITIKQDKPIYLPLELKLVTQGMDTIRLRKKEIAFPSDTVQVNTNDKIRYVLADPDRKIWELYRLNNRYPRKIRFKLPFKLPSVDTYEIFTYPTLDFNDRDRVRIGLKLKGAYWLNLRPIFPAESFDDWSLELNYGYKSHTFGYEASYSTSLLNMFFQPRITIRGQDYYGIEQRTVQSSWYLGRIHYPFVSRVVGYKRLTAQLIFQRVHSLEFTGDNNWEKGVSFVPTFTFINFHNWNSFRHILRITYRQGMKYFGADYSFRQFTGDVIFKVKLQDKSWFYNRIFSGMTWGNIPVQRYLQFFGKNIFQNLSLQNIRQVKGMGDMRGYGDQSIRGKAIFTTNNELHFNIVKLQQLHLDILAFHDFGWVGNKIDVLKFGRARTDAGIGFELDFYEYIKAGFHIPLYVSHPAGGEKQWKFRWVVSYRLNI